MTDTTWKRTLPRRPLAAFYLPLIPNATNPTLAAEHPNDVVEVAVSYDDTGPSSSSR